MILWRWLGLWLVGPEEILDRILLGCEIIGACSMTDHPWGSCLPRSLTLSLDLRIHTYTPEYLRIVTLFLHGGKESLNQFQFSLGGLDVLVFNEADAARLNPGSRHKVELAKPQRHPPNF